MVTYDKNGLCTKCGFPSSGFVEDGVCECCEEEERTERLRSRLRLLREKADRMLYR